MIDCAYLSERACVSVRIHACTRACACMRVRLRACVRVPSVQRIGAFGKRRECATGCAFHGDALSDEQTAAVLRQQPSCMHDAGCVEAAYVVLPTSRKSWRLGRWSMAALSLSFFMRVSNAMAALARAGATFVCGSTLVCRCRCGGWMPRTQGSRVCEPSSIEQVRACVSE